MRPLLFTCILFLCCQPLATLARVDDASSLRAFLDQAKANGFPVDFLYKVLPSLKIQFGGVGSGASAEFNRKDTILLEKALSVDEEGGGGLKSYSLISDSDKGTVFHELFHAYMKWVQDESAKSGGDVEARRLADFIRTSRCRYVNVTLTDGSKKSLSESDQYDLLNENWGIWFGGFLMRQWAQTAFQSRRGVLPAGGLDAERQKLIREAAQQRKEVGYYHRFRIPDGWIQIDVTADSAMSANEMKFLMKHVLKMPAAFIEDTFKDFPRPLEKDRTCINTSLVFVLDASGSMGDRKSGATTSKIEEAKQQINDSLAQVGSDVEMALIVYRDCGNIQVEEDFTTDKTLISEALKNVSPSGGTPIAAAAEFAANYMRKNARGRQARFVGLTDGAETCGGDTLKAGQNINKKSGP